MTFWWRSPARAMAYALRNTLRIVETAAYLADHGRLHLLLRQQVLLVPKRLGYFMQRDRAMFDTIPRSLRAFTLHRTNALGGPKPVPYLTSCV